MPREILIPLPDRDFDVTEVAVPWKLLTEAGLRVVFATEEGATPAADPLLIHGVVFGRLGARSEPLAFYRQLDTFVRACRALGYPESPDNNAPASTGVGPHPMNKRGRLRVGTLVAYVMPARGRPNLTIQSNAFVTWLAFDGNRCTSVEAEIDGAPQLFEGDKIVLAGGAIMSPAILMRSGVGPEANLRELGIPVVADLPGVGANLLDHPMTGATWRAKPGVLKPDDPLVQTTMRYTSTGGAERNDMQVMPVSQLPARGGEWIFSIGTVVERPRSVGRLTLQSRNPDVQPRIDQRFAEHDEDVGRMVEGIKMALEIGSHREFEGLLDGLYSPGPEVFKSDKALADFVRSTASSGFHPCGTARMGTSDDREAVVDQYCRVRGFDNLFVVDASIMPTVPRANLNMTCIMFGERFGEWLHQGVV